jgi:hypothetical protein
MTHHPNVTARILVLDADPKIGFSLQLTKSILKKFFTVSADLQICKDVRSELELLDCKILKQQRLRRVQFRRAIF